MPQVSTYLQLDKSELGSTKRTWDDLLHSGGDNYSADTCPTSDESKLEMSTLSQLYLSEEDLAVSSDSKEDCG